jgi:hypothetical protein
VTRQLFAACYLEDADVGDVCGCGDDAEGFSGRDGFLDGVPPFAFGAGAAGGGAPHPGERLHLSAASSFDSLPESCDCRRAAGVVEADGDAECAGLVAEAVVVAGVLLECFVVSHTGKVAYRAVGVKW